MELEQITVNGQSLAELVRDRTFIGYIYDDNDDTMGYCPYCCRNMISCECYD